jgi:DNA-binding IclR family transcriptional regulator
VSRSLVYRVIRELETRSLVSAESGQYKLGVATLEIGGAYAKVAGYAEGAQAVLRELSNRTGETSNLAVLVGSEVLYVLKQDGANSVMTLSQVGTRLPAHCTALGKALLAALPDEELDRRFPDSLPRLTSRSIGTKVELLAELARVREMDYALDDEETIIGRCCAAVRVTAPEFHGGAAALSTSASTEGFLKRRDELLDALFDAGDRLKRESAARAALGNEPVLLLG